MVDKMREALAAEILKQARQAVAKGKDGVSYPWYLINTNQPALRQAYNQHKATELKLMLTDAPGDMDRLRWELGLLNDAAVEMLCRFYKTEDQE